MQSDKRTGFRSEWKKALSSRRFVFMLVFSLITMAMLGLFVEAYFVGVIGKRPGYLINDPVLNFFVPVDWSLEIMTLIYTGILISVAVNIGKPWNFLLALSAYAVVSWTRMFTMYIFTLEAPVGVIPLNDPFLLMLVYKRSDFVKDLFYSGHVSSLCVLIAVEQHRLIRWILIIMTAVMTLFILWQHVHYTVDVVFAPIFAFLIVFLLKKYVLKKPLTD